MPNQTLFKTLKILLSPEIIMEDGDFLEISISNPPHLLLKNYKDTKISYSDAIDNLVENKRNVDLFLKASDIMEKLIPYRLNSLTRSCSLVINSRPKETTAFVQDKDVFLTGHPSSINIFKPKVNLFQQASILINGEEENVRDLEEKPKIISLKDKSLQTNFNITNSVPEKCIDPNTQIEYIIYMIKNIYEHSFIKYNYSLISCLNNVTTQLSIQISEDPSSLSDKDIDKYRRYTQFKTILVNNESEIQEIINEIDKILIGDKLERNAQDKI